MVMFTGVCHVSSSQLNPKSQSDRIKQSTTAESSCVLCFLLPESTPHKRSAPKAMGFMGYLNSIS